jgi:tight adherence protein B
MSISYLTLMTFASTALLVVSLGMLLYDWMFRYRAVVRERMKSLAMQDVPEHNIYLFKNRGRNDVSQISERSAFDQLGQLLEQAGMSCSIGSFAVWSLIAGILCGGIGLWFSAWVGAALLSIGMGLPVLYAIARRHARRRKLCRQLPDAFQMISRAVRSGQTVPSALKIIADDFDAPLSNEFSLCYEQQNFGVSREVALRKLAKRVGVMELQIFVVALLVQAKSGGNLVELLDNLSITIRNRLKLSDRVRALTGEGRMQAIILLLLPTASLVGIFLLSPEYAAGILQWPKLLAFTAAAQAAGAFWIRKIISIQY